MQYKQIAALSAATLATSVSASGYKPGDVWSTLTPSGTYAGGYSSYSASFGIAVEAIATTSAASVAKRGVASQVPDGQIQATTGTVKPTASLATTKTTVAAVSQIGDGQIQATSAASTPKNSAATTPAETAKNTPAESVKNTPTESVKNTASNTAKNTPTESAKNTAVPKTTLPAISQITDGQIQATADKVKSTQAPVSQVSDGQVQATTSAKSSAGAASQITDGQVQATTKVTSTLSPASSTSPKQSGALEIENVSCASSGTLTIQLKDGVLTDSKGRIGSIVANRQFQFDGPPPQAGAIYAAGWSITPEGNLALGSSDVFYQCLSGNFYNLYDESIGAQCHPVHLEVVTLTDC